MSEWMGRGESRPWPTKWPVSCFGAFLIAFAVGVGIFVYQTTVVWTPLERWYWNQYLGSEVFPIRGNQPGNYHVLAKLDRHNHPLLAVDADVVPGPVEGKQLIPFTLSAAARQAGAVELKLERAEQTTLRIKQ